MADSFSNSLRGMETALSSLWFLGKALQTASLIPSGEWKQTNRPVLQKASRFQTASLIPSGEWKLREGFFPIPYGFFRQLL